MKYRNWIAWQRSVDLSVSVYQVLRYLSGPETCALANQMRRSSISVPDNVAEAFGRFSFRDQRQFVIRARGSLFELDTQIELGRRLHLIEKETADRLVAEIEEVARLLHGLIRMMARQARDQDKDKTGANRSRADRDTDCDQP